MSAKFSQNIRGFSCNSFINTLQTKSPDVWLPNTNYTIGDVRISGSNKYCVLSSGMSGVNPPSHITGSVSDGSLNWMFVETITRDNTYRGNMFVAIGNSLPWVNESTPPVPNMSSLGDLDTLNGMITLKNITSNNVRMVAVRNDWTSGVVYSQFDPTVDTFESNAYVTPYYVVTDELKIYKCLDNNNGSPSVSKPISTGITPVILADGYCWKYLGYISSQDASTFLTTGFIPVKYIIQNDGSDQWAIQQVAQIGGISTFSIKQQVGTFTGTDVTIEGMGSNVVANVIKTNTNTIRQIVALESGTGYTTETYAIVKNALEPGSGATATATILNGIITSVTVDLNGTGYTDAVALIVGDGAGATITPTVSVSNTISSITVNSGGTGYTWAKVFIIPGTAGCVAKAILAPHNGHGYNMVNELGATAIIISIRLENNAHLLTGDGSDYRQIAIVTDVLDSNSEPAYLSHYIGPSHPEYNNIGSSLHKIKQGSGYVLYLSNIQVVTRSVNEEENIKLIILF